MRWHKITVVAASVCRIDLHTDYIHSDLKKVAVQGIIPASGLTDCKDAVIVPSSKSIPMGALLWMR